MWTAPETDEVVEAGWQPPATDAVVESPEAIQTRRAAEWQAMKERAVWDAQSDWGPSVSPEEQATAPLIPLPRMTVPVAPPADPNEKWYPDFESVSDQGSLRPSTGAALVNTAAGFAEFATSPLGIRTAAIGGAGGPLVRKIIAGAFAADMAKNTPEAARAAGEASVTGTPQEQAEANLGLAANIGLAGTLGAHAAAPKVTVNPALKPAGTLAREAVTAELPKGEIRFRPPESDPIVATAGERAKPEGMVTRETWTPPARDVVVREPLPSEMEYAGGEMPRTPAVGGEVPEGKTPSSAKATEGGPNNKAQTPKETPNTKTQTPPPPAKVLKAGNVNTSADVQGATAAKPLGEGSSFSPKEAKEQKKFLLDAIDQAIAEAPDKRPTNPADADAQLLLTVKHWAQGDTKQTFEARETEVLKTLAEKYGVPEKDPYAGSGIPYESLKERIDTAIKKAQTEGAPKVTIEVPGDGVFTIVNSKEALNNFAERAAKFPTTAPRAKTASTPRGTPTPPAALGKADTVGTIRALKNTVSFDATRGQAIQHIWSDGEQSVSVNGRMLTLIRNGLGGTKKAPKLFAPDGREYKLPKGEGEFPSWQQVVPEKFREEMKNVDTQKLFTVVRQAQEATSEKANAITLWKNKDGSLGVTANSPENTSYVHNYFPGAKVIMAMDPTLLLEGINAARSVGDGKVRLKWTDELAPLRIDHDKGFSVIMPMRLGEGVPYWSPEVKPAAKPAKGAKPSGTSGVGFPAAAAPVPPTPSPAPAPGVTMIQHGRLPVTLDRTVAGSVSVPQIMDSMQRVLRAAGSQAGNLRTGRFLNKALGIWKPHEEIIRMESADSIPTATHEVGHGLQQLIYGTFKAGGLKFLSPAIRRELIGMGRALYGSRKPVAGYTGEGFAEFARYWLTTDDAAKVAPQMTKFFETQFLPKHPEVAKSLAEARSLVDIWRAQGSVERAQRQLVKEPGAWRKVAEALAKVVGYQSQFESGAPIEAVSKAAARKLGRPLRPSEDPYSLYSAKRGTAGATVERMATEHMLDVWGNPVGPSLAEALAPIKGRRKEFLLYVFAQAAEMRWKQNKNPGISLEDARHIKGLYDSPEFRLAADKYRKWNDQLLDYAVQADPSMADAVAAMRGANDFYAPLARMIDPAKAKAAAANAQSNSFQRMFGSGLPVKDIFDQTFINAARLVNRANRALVARSLIKLSNIQGLGHIVEEVPRDRVAERFNVEQIRKQLESMGVDTSMIPKDEILQYYSLADKPKGSDPIVSVKDSSGQTRWYQVDPRLYDTLEGLQTFSLKQSFPGIPYLGQVLDLLLGTPSRAFRLGTTGLRPAFSLVTNPARDVATLLAQTSSNPAKVAAMYPAAMKEAIRGGPYKSAFYDLGAHLGQPLGTDIGHTQRVSKELFHGRIMRVVRNPVDHFRELLSITESAPRIAELRAVADDIGWKPGTPLSPDQAVQLTLAAKRVTVDFSAAGDVSRVLNQAIPFYNPALQGLRSFARAFKNDPAKASLMGLALFTAPALALWWQNKDKEWYQALPWRERYLYTHIDDGTNVWRIPRPFEWGNVFMVMPEAILDSFYRHDPEAAKQALAHTFESTNPADLPVLAKLAKEQWQNKIDFWDRPIVPRSEVDLPAAEQFGPYTSRLALAINKAFPEVSPRRVDAAVRGYFGGAGTDLMDMVGIGSQRRDRDWEASDFPVFGALFRRGGEFNAQNQHINDFWDAYLPSRARVAGFNNARRQAEQGLRDPATIKPPSLGDLTAAQEGAKASPAIQALLTMAARTKDTKARAELYRQAGEMARGATTVIRNAQKTDEQK